MTEIQSALPTAIPSWVMLDQRFRYKDLSSFRADDESSAETQDTNGEAVRVSFEIQSPPGSSGLCLHDPEGRESWWDIVVAAHNDAVLFRIEVDFDGLPHNQSHATDYFIYRAAPPSSGPKLTLLPRCYSTTAEIQELGAAGWRSRWRMVSHSGTGLLTTEKGFVVAELCVDAYSAADKTATLEAELFRLISPWTPASADGGVQWELTLARSRDSKLSFEKFIVWESHTVVPFTSYLCWVDYNQGVLFCDVFTKTPELQYLPLPIEDMPLEEFPTFSRTLCVTNEGLAMKFVKVSEMPSRTNRKLLSGFIISVWRMEVVDHDIKNWVVDVEITDNELWAMDGYDHDCLPRSVPQCPLVSMDDPNILYFVVTGRPAISDVSETWIVTLDITSKIVLRYDCIKASPSDNILNGFGFFPSNFTKFLVKHSKGEYYLEEEKRADQEEKHQLCLI